MRDLNCCHFIGRLGRSPEATYLPNGDIVVNFSIACSDDYKDKDRNSVERTNWIRIVAFRNLGDLVHKYCVKGSQVFVSGKQRTKKWTNKNGDDQYTTEIVADNVQFLGKKDDVKNIPSHQAPEITEEFQDDIPF